MSPFESPANARSSAPTVGRAVAVVRMVIAVVASMVAILTGTLLLGAYVPAIPKVGVIGPVLGGQYPFHMALLALVGAGLAVLVRRTGLVRWGRTLTAATALSTLAALAIGGIQFTAAQRAGTDVSWKEVFTEPALPAAEPDATVTYARPEGRPLQADLYLPRTNQRKQTPAIVLAHAGGFHTFDKSDLRGTGRWLADHGVAVLAVDYRLAAPGRPTWDKAPQDLVCALGWVREHAHEYGVAPAQVSLGGMSAGGTLAMNAAYRLRNGTITSSCGPTTDPPASVVGFYPGTDVARMWEENTAGSREAAELFTGGAPLEYPDRYRQVSPASDVHGRLPRTLLVVGDRDRSARPESVRELGDALTSHGTDVDVEVLPFAEHSFDDVYGSLSAQTSRQVLLDFLTADPH